MGARPADSSKQRRGRRLPLRPRLPTRRSPLASAVRRDARHADCCRSLAARERHTNVPLCVPALWDTAPAGWPGAVGLTGPLRLTTRRRREAPASPLPSFARVPRSRERRFLLSTRRSAERTRPTFFAGGDPRRRPAGGHATLPPPSTRRMLRPAGPCGRAPEPATRAGGGAQRHEAAAGGPLAGAPDAQRRRLGRARRGGLGTYGPGWARAARPRVPDPQRRRPATRRRRAVSSSALNPFASAGSPGPRRQRPSPAGAASF